MSIDTSIPSYFQLQLDHDRYLRDMSYGYLINPDTREIMNEERKRLRFQQLENHQNKTNQARQWESNRENASRMNDRNKLTARSCQVAKEEYIPKYILHDKSDVKKKKKKFKFKKLVTRLIPKQVEVETDLRSDQFTQAHKQFLQHELIRLKQLSKFANN